MVSFLLNYDLDKITDLKKHPSYPGYLGSRLLGIYTDCREIEKGQWRIHALVKEGNLLRQPATNSGRR
jgi:hypothetical protein